MKKTKRTIFDAAIKVFSKFGYVGATMDLIMAEGNVAKGTIYYNFKNKEDLFHFVIREGINLINEEIYNETKDIQDPYERMKVSSKVQLKYVYENKDLFKVILSEIWGTDERNSVLREEVKEMLDRSSEQYKLVIDKGYIEQGDPIFLSYAFIGMLFSAVLYDLLHENEFTYEDLAEKFMSYLQYGIRVRE
ncbi:MAG: TetR/AcrR family transcriptional regulator [Clostridium sp.]